MLSSFSFLLPYQVSSLVFIFHPLKVTTRRFLISSYACASQSFDHIVVLLLGFSGFRPRAVNVIPGINHKDNYGDDNIGVKTLTKQRNIFGLRLRLRQSNPVNHQTTMWAGRFIRKKDRLATRAANSFRDHSYTSNLRTP